MDASIPRQVGNPRDPDADPLETREWIESLDALIQNEGPQRATFLLRRLSQHDHYRRETSGEGLSSYPHPWLMPHFWQFPTGSMGIGPLFAIYQARFMRYLENRGLLEGAESNTTARKVWCFVGDGEMDEPE